MKFSFYLKSNEWHCRALLFHNFAKSISCLLQKLLSIHNRALLYDLYSYILDMNSTIDLCSKYLHWLGNEYFLFDELFNKKKIICRSE
jgi:hypothetical protein